MRCLCSGSGSVLFTSLSRVCELLLLLDDFLSADLLDDLFILSDDLSETDFLSDDFLSDLSRLLLRCFSLLHP